MYPLSACYALSGLLCCAVFCTAKDDWPARRTTWDMCGFPLATSLSKVLIGMNYNSTNELRRSLSSLYAGSKKHGFISTYPSCTPRFLLCLNLRPVLVGFTRPAVLTSPAQPGEVTHQQIVHPFESTVSPEDNTFSSVFFVVVPITTVHDTSLAHFICLHSSMLLFLP
ncbi:hypothetical protein F5Y12DRAFT_551248 [Xylaria sp. FL1777]|nr:hypothetical protein F5Y12DRAFT_551248 [Xylaria sp. FL1777]